MTAKIRESLKTGGLVFIFSLILFLSGCSEQSGQNTGVKETTNTAATAGNVTTAANQEKDNQCIQCHQNQTPGIVDQYHNSKHSQQGVDCLTCHQPAKGQEKMAKTHNGFTIVINPTPNNCVTCHANEVKEFSDSRHGGRAWYPIVGAEETTPGGYTKDELVLTHALDASGSPLNSGKPNIIKSFIGADAAAVSCEVCHGIGRKNPDGSFGDCTKCHLRHNFSVSQARQPETCGQCHLGPDHPQVEVYNESAHGAYYQANKDKFKLDAPAGSLTTKEFPAPTCATCHMSAFGKAKGTHDVGLRLKWNLASQYATVRPDGDKNRETMEQVCTNCHSKNFTGSQLAKGEKVIDLTNQNNKKGQDILDDLKKNKLVNSAAMSSSADILNFELWHHEGRRARSGVMMFAPDYANWHGIYEQQKNLIELQATADELKKNH